MRTARDGPAAIVEICQFGRGAQLRRSSHHTVTHIALGADAHLGIVPVRIVRHRRVVGITVTRRRHAEGSAQTLRETYLGRSLHAVAQNTDAGNVDVAI